MSDEIVDFDSYVDDYEELLEKQLSFFSSARDYFSSYKITLLRRNIQDEPLKVLDFGCGIGLSLPHLIKAFPNSEIYGSDISQKSLDYVKNSYPQVNVIAHLEEHSSSFDLVFLAGVIHHIPPSHRSIVMKQVFKLVKPGGEVCIFEHNPFNPITRKIVSNCPFDKGVVLLSKANLIKLMDEACLKVTKHAYCLFFPHQVRYLRHLEPLLQKVPLGGQYFAIGKKIDG